MSIKSKIDNFFESSAIAIYNKPKLAIIVAVLVFASLISQLKNITVDTSNEAFLHKDDTALTVYNQFRDQFGRDERIIVALNPPNVFDLKFLGKLKKLHEDIEETLPYIEEVDSLINATNTYGAKDEMIVEDLFENFPTTQEQADKIGKIALNKKLYKNLLLSEDGKFTVLSIKMSTYKEEQEDEEDTGEFVENPEGLDEQELLGNNEIAVTLQKLDELLAKYKADDFPYVVAGSPVTTNNLMKSMQADMPVFIGSSLLTIAVFLFLLFRRFSAVFMPLIVVALALISTMGFIGLVGGVVTVMNQILPTFLLAVGVGDSVHILTIFYQELKKGVPKKEAIIRSVKHSALAVLMTTITTAGALLSFAGAEIAPIGDLGKFAAIGVVFALIYTVFLLPALIAVLPIRENLRLDNKSGSTISQRLIIKIGDFSANNAKLVSVVSFIILGVSLYGASKIIFAHDVLKWFPKGHQVREATTLIDDKLKGTINIEIILDTGKINGLHEPKFLNSLNNVAEKLYLIEEGPIKAAQSLSLADTLKEIHQALNENNPEFYVVPQNKKLIAQELFLFENTGADDIQKLVDSQFSKARFTAKLPWNDAIKFTRYNQRVKELFESEFDKSVNIEVTGLIAILVKTLTAAINSLSQSYLYAAVVITVLMVIMIGSVKVGLLSMLPNIGSIVVTLGIMGFAGIPMDLFTLLIGSIAIGLAVDDTIHYVHNFQKSFHVHGNAKRAVRETMETTGQAMLFTTIVLSVGFLIFTLSQMNNLFNFGLLTCLTLMFALLLTYFFGTALLVLSAKK